MGRRASRSQMICLARNIYCFRTTSFLIFFRLRDGMLLLFRDVQCALRDLTGAVSDKESTSLIQVFGPSTRESPRYSRVSACLLYRAIVAIRVARGRRHYRRCDIVCDADATLD